MTNLTIAGSEFSLTVSPSVLESIARRVVEILVAEGRVPEPAADSTGT